MKTTFLSLDARAIDYLRGELEAANPLGRAVLAAMVLDDGIIAAVVPEPHRPDAYAFRSGIFERAARGRTPVSGGYIEAVPSTESTVSTWVHGALQSDPRRAIVCESYLLRAGDLARATKLPRRTSSCGEFVYHWAAHDDPETDVAAVVRMTYALPLGMAVICTPSVNPSALFDGGAVDPLSTVARSTECVLVGAYDGESVLVWVRHGSPIRLPCST